MDARFLFTLSLVAVALLSACAKSDSPPPANLTAAEAPQTIKGAFDQAQPEIKQAANDLAQTIQAGKPVESFMQLQRFNGQANLTAEQRSALARSQIAVMKQLDEAANRGDAQAAEVVNTYRSQK